MTNFSNRTIMERTELIEDALAVALDLPVLAIEYDKLERELIVADPSMLDVFRHHNLYAIAREVERRLFPNG